MPLPKQRQKCFKPPLPFETVALTPAPRKVTKPDAALVITTDSAAVRRLGIIVPTLESEVVRYDTLRAQIVRHKAQSSTSNHRPAIRRCHVIALPFDYCTQNT